MTPTQPPSTRGALSILVVVYAILTLAALGRSGYQLATKFDLAPLAYSLSGVAAVVYAVATWALVFSSRAIAHRVALIALGFEAVGVVAVGSLSVWQPNLFADATVWSEFGRGYGYLPLVLPFVGLWWLRHASRPPQPGM